MKTILIISILLTGCANTSVFIGFGKVTTPGLDKHYDAVANSGIAILRVHHPITKNTVIEYEHQSSVLDGPPLNDSIDDRWHERISIIYKLR